MIVNESAENSEPNKVKASNEALLQEAESLKSTLPCVSPPQQVVQFCPLPSYMFHLKWWLVELIGSKDITMPMTVM